MIRSIASLILLSCLGCGPTLIERGSNTQPPPDLDFPVGPFSLIERDGRTVTNQDLRGKVWVGSFIFTRCTGPCPAVTGTVKGLRDDLGDIPNVRFVTFTVDPARDRPDELKKYADRYHADPEKWLFLTGDEKTIHSLMRLSFKLAVGRREGANVPSGDEFDHSTRLVVVDKRGIMRAIFDGIRNDLQPNAKQTFEENLSRLKQKVRELSVEK